MLAAVVLFACAFRPPVSISVDWSQTVATAGRSVYGLNIFRGHSPEIAQSPQYRAALSVMAPGFVRYHSMEAGNDSTTPQGWIDTANRRWDEAKILRALDQPLPGNPIVLVNIARWPAWLETKHRGLPDDPRVYAAWCASLARILAKAKTPVKYLEITNELDGVTYTDLRQSGGYGPPKDSKVLDRIQELADLYIAAARAIKSANPALKVGGPAAARADLIPFATRFIQLTQSELDFYSAHTYASGSASDTNEKILDRAGSMVEDCARLRTAIRTQTQNTLPLFIDEFNISWTWETRDVRMTNHLGAVFDALVLFGMAKSGIEATAAWNEQDGIYGKSDAEGKLRPAAYLYQSLNTHGVGQIRESRSSDPGIVTYAVENSVGRALWLVNRTDRAQSVAGMRFPRATMLTSEGLLQDRELTSLPAHSVSWVIWRK